MRGALLVMAIAGAVLIGQSFRTPVRKLPETPLVLSWALAAPTKSTFKMSLTPPGEGVELANDILAILRGEEGIPDDAWGGLDALLSLDAEPVRLTAEARLTRVVSDGRIFDHRFDLALESEGERWSFELDLYSDGASQQSYRGVWDGSDLAEVTVTEEGTTRPLQIGELARSIPLSIGDIHIWDVMELLWAARDGEIEALGHLEGGRAQRTLVVEIPFLSSLESSASVAEPDPDGQAEDGKVEDASRFAGLGASALAYLGADDLKIRSLRIFDRDKRLVRTYFGFAPTGPDHLPFSIAISSLPSSSYSIVSIEAFNIEKLSSS